MNCENPRRIDLTEFHLKNYNLNSGCKDQYSITILELYATTPPGKIGAINWEI